MIWIVSRRKKCIKRWLKGNYSLKTIFHTFCTNMNMVDTLLLLYRWCRQGSATKFYLWMLRDVIFFPPLSFTFHWKWYSLITLLGAFICPRHHEKEDVGFIPYFRISPTTDFVSTRHIPFLWKKEIQFLPQSFCLIVQSLKVGSIAPHIWKAKVS